MDSTLSAEPPPKETEVLKAEFEMYLREMRRSMERMDEDQKLINDIRARTDARLTEIDALLKEIRAVAAKSSTTA